MLRHLRLQRRHLYLLQRERCLLRWTVNKFIFLINSIKILYILSEFFNRTTGKAKSVYYSFSTDIMCCKEGQKCNTDKGNCNVQCPGGHMSCDPGETCCGTGDTYTCCGGSAPVCCIGGDWFGPVIRCCRTDEVCDGSGYCQRR
ncbi:hypothetical protein PFISCL1PPCAC_21601 [Pristionchus fissidentatus]|uniref:Granulins domain-containing protein n=1 Tax=Pristionchus fissidentatus TaxID=1538716 RepID=A0AAV5WE49_9BILA|nr:hypothetical protein PFISCL1PPCAC_21601 [Pristionchus fissidentatus]